MKDDRLMQVLLAPHVSEKSNRLAAERQYVFKVATDAVKAEIKKAVEKLFSVNVLSVRVCHVKGKTKQRGRFPAGKRKDWKKAYVLLQEGQSIQCGVKA